MVGEDIANFAAGMAPEAPSNLSAAAREFVPGRQGLCAQAKEFVPGGCVAALTPMEGTDMAALPCGGWMGPMPDLAPPVWSQGNADHLARVDDVAPPAWGQGASDHAAGMTTAAAVAGPGGTSGGDGAIMADFPTNMMSFNAQEFCLIPAVAMPIQPNMQVGGWDIQQLQLPSTPAASEVGNSIPEGCQGDWHAKHVVTEQGDTVDNSPMASQSMLRPGVSAPRSAWASAARSAAVAESFAEQGAFPGTSNFDGEFDSTTSTVSGISSGKSSDFSDASDGIVASEEQEHLPEQLGKMPEQDDKGNQVAVVKNSKETPAVHLDACCHAECLEVHVQSINGWVGWQEHAEAAQWIMSSAGMELTDSIGTVVGKGAPVLRLADEVPAAPTNLAGSDEVIAEKVWTLKASLKQGADASNSDGDGDEERHSSSMDSDGSTTGREETAQESSEERSRESCASSDSGEGSISTSVEASGACCRRRWKQQQQQQQQECKSSCAAEVEISARKSTLMYTVEELLQWRAAVLSQGLHDPNLRYGTAAVAVTRPKAAPRRGADKDRTPQTPQRAPVPPLEASPTSWSAQQQARRKSGGQPDDAEVVRSMKAILNKLTVERFEALYKQLISCGISSAVHVEVLIRELFEKATTQHHFIGMYAELCARLHSWFVDAQIFGDEGKSFKRILLSRCQRCFEDIFRPQEDLEQNQSACSEQEEEAALLRKMQMLGNLKFIGALLERSMLASKILISVVEELLCMGTAASLECLAVFLTAVGPSFDRPNWTNHAKLLAAFRKVQDFAKDRRIPSRCRFLLQDLLDLRASGWQNTKKAVRTEDGPTTLEAVHRRAAEEEFGMKPQERTPMRSPCSSSGGGGFGSAAATASANAGGAGGKAAALPLRTPPARRSFCASPMGSSAPSGRSRGLEEGAAEGPVATPPPLPRGGCGLSCKYFDKKSFGAERVRILSCLQRSCGVSKAFDALANWSVPLEFQASELAEILPEIIGWASAASRCAGFELLVRLFTSGTWRRAALGKGLSEFFDNFAELKLDVPTLPHIVREELAPSLARLVEQGLLEAERGRRFLAMAA